MGFLNPTVSDFQSFFARDFPYGTDVETTVVDGDITKAFSFAVNSINQELFSTQEAYTNGFLLLSAHYLVLNLRASTQGLNGQFNWLQNSKSVGSVSESFSIPQRILDNPDLALFTKTNYGAMYLQSIISLLSGQVFTVCGGTQA